jgi:hypothetical protein
MWPAHTTSLNRNLLTLAACRWGYYYSMKEFERRGKHISLSMAYLASRNWKATTFLRWEPTAPDCRLRREGMHASESEVVRGDS